MKRQTGKSFLKVLLCVGLSLALVMEVFLLPSESGIVRAAEEQGVAVSGEDASASSEASGRLDAMELPPEEPDEEEELAPFISDDEDNPETLTYEEMQELKEEGLWEESLAVMQRRAAEQEEAQNSLFANLAQYGSAEEEGDLQSVSPEAAYQESRGKVTGVSYTMPAIGDVKGLVFAVEFADMTFSDKFKKGIGQIFFGRENKNSPNYPYESVAAYYNRASYGSFRLSGNVVYYRSKHPRDYYSNARQDNSLLYKEIFEAYKKQLLNRKKQTGESDEKCLARELAKFDSDGDRRVDGVYIVYAGAAGKWASQWWSYREGGYTYDFGAGYSLKGIIFMNSKKGNLASCARTAIHETGHYLGLADLYSYEKGGYDKLLTFDMMENNAGDHNAFSKMLLGWLPKSNVEVITADKIGASLTPYAGGSGNVKLIMPVSEWSRYGIYSQFIMAEYYKKTGNDSLPGVKAADGLRLYHVYARLNSRQTGFAATNMKDRYLPLISAMDRDFDSHKLNGKGNRIYDNYLNCFYTDGNELSPWSVPGSSFYEDQKGDGLNKDSILRYSGIFIHNIKLPSADGDLTFNISFLPDPSYYSDSASQTALKLYGRYSTENKKAEKLYVRLRFNQEVNIADSAEVQLYDADTGAKIFTLSRAWLSTTFPDRTWSCTAHRVYIKLTKPLVKGRHIKGVIPVGSFVTPAGTYNEKSISFTYDGTSLQTQSAVSNSSEQGSSGDNQSNSPVEKKEGRYSWETWVDEGGNGGMIVLDENEAEEPGLTFYPIHKGDPDTAHSVSIDIAGKQTEYDLEEARIAQLKGLSSGDYLLTIGDIRKTWIEEPGEYTGDQVDEGWITISEEGEAETPEGDAGTETAGGEAGTESTEAESAYFLLLRLSSAGQIKSKRILEAGSVYCAGLVEERFCLITPGEEENTQLLERYSFDPDEEPDSAQIKAGISNQEAMVNTGCQPAVKQEGGYLAVAADGYSWELLNEDYTAGTVFGWEYYPEGIHYTNGSWYVLGYVDESGVSEEGRSHVIPKPSEKGKDSGLEDEELEEGYVLAIYDGGLSFEAMKEAVPKATLLLEDFGNNLAVAGDGSMLIYEKDGPGYLYDRDALEENQSYYYDGVAVYDDLAIHNAFPSSSGGEILIACDSNIYSADDEAEHRDEIEEVVETEEASDPGEFYLTWLAYIDQKSFAKTITPQIVTKELGKAALWNTYWLLLSCDVDIPVVWSITTDITEEQGVLEVDSESGVLTGEFYETGSYSVTVRVANEENQELFSTKDMTLEVEEETTFVYLYNVPPYVYYTGKPITFPYALASYHDAILNTGTECIFSYKDNINVGTGKLICTLKGGYTGQVPTEFEIRAANIAGEEFLTPDIHLNWTGKKLKVSPILLRNGIKLKENRDYTLTGNVEIKDAGTYTLTLEGKGNYTGSRELTVIVSKEKKKTQAISAALKGLKIPAQRYAGVSLEPVSAKLLEESGISLKQNEDFAVFYQNNVNAGTATAIFTGLGSYTGEARKTFRIEKYVLTPGDEAVTVTMPAEIEFAKAGMKTNPYVGVTLYGNKETPLTEGVDYTISYRNNKTITPGKPAMAVINGKGNFSGTISRSFTGLRQDLSLTTCYMDDVVWKKNMTAASILNKKPVLLDPDGVKLKAGTDYGNPAFTYAEDITLADGSARKAGDAVVKTDRLPLGAVIKFTVPAAGNCYKGQATGLIRAVEKSIAGHRFKLTSEVIADIFPLVFTDDIACTTADATFELIYSSCNVKTKELKVVIRGTGVYGCLKTLSFKASSKKIISANRIY